MKEKLISAPTVKLAKKKGYVIKTKKVQIDFIPSSWSWMVGTPIYKEVEIKPTQALLQKWLREEKKCFICVKHRIIGSVENPIIEYTYNGDNGEWNQKYYQTYEEALEQALIESLNLIA